MYIVISSMKDPFTDEETEIQGEYKEKWIVTDEFEVGQF